MQKIKIDFNNPGLPQHISAVENDSQSRFFQATLCENGKAYTAPAGASYSIMYRGFGPQNQGWYDTINDGAGKRAACKVSGNVVTCEIARQALQVPGHVSIVLCVTTGRGYMLKSWPIECDCKNDHYDSTAEIQSFFYITQISNESWTQVIQAAEELKNTIDPTLSLSGKAADAAKVGEAVNAESERAKGVENQLKEDIGYDVNTMLNKSVNYVDRIEWENGTIDSRNGNLVDDVTGSKKRTKAFFPLFAISNFLINYYARNYTVLIFKYNKQGALDSFVELANYNNENAQSDFSFDIDFDYKIVLNQRRGGEAILSNLKISAKNEILDYVYSKKETYTRKEIDAFIERDKKIVAVGDSLTFGTGSEDKSPDNKLHPYTEWVENITGVQTINMGVGGDDCHDIFSRLGSEAIILNNITIPANQDEVEIGFPLKTINSNVIDADWYYAANFYTQDTYKYKINPVVLNGVHGIIKQNKSRNMFTFQRLDGGEQVIVSRPTVLQTYSVNNFVGKDYIYIFYVGQNGGFSSIDDWITQIKNAVAYLGCKKYLIIAYNTNTYNTAWANYISKFKKTFGSNYLDVRQYMLDYGLADAGLSPTEADTASIQTGVIPPSLKKDGDNTHYNYLGYKVLGTLISKRLMEIYPRYFD
nr:MAG TPA: SGNH-hydrolase family esterase [Caudoviricetes sp.]